MSNVAELQYFCNPQAHIINSQSQKQQPASKLVNKYLSTAAQYINKAKTFHLPTTNNNNNIEEYISDNHLLANNVAQLIPNTKNNINVPIDINTHPTNLLMAVNEINSSALPSDDTNNSIESNKSQGFVNTIRRSLRKNKIRFYNKRAATMKSCHSLYTYDQTVHDNPESPSKSSMTPVLLCRHQTLSGNISMRLDKDSDDNQIRKNRKKNN